MTREPTWEPIDPDDLPKQTDAARRRLLLGHRDRWGFAQRERSDDCWEWNLGGKPDEDDTNGSGND